MQGGDLSNAVPMRWLITWEEAIVRLPERSAGGYRAWVRLGQWRRALDCWVTSRQAVTVLTDLAIRQNRQFDVVSHLAPGNERFRAALEERLERDGIPASRVESATRDEMQQEMAHRPDIVAVVHGGPLFAYGARGVHVHDPNAMRRLL